MTIRLRLLILILFVFSLSLQVTARAHAFPAGRTWQVLGKARALPTFYLPTSVAIGPTGNIYVLDSGNFRVLVLSPAGRLLARFGSAGTDSDQFGITTLKTSEGNTRIGPTSMAVDRRGNIYVADWAKSRIAKYTWNGRFLANWPISVPGGVGGRMAVTVGPGGNVVVAIAAHTDCPNTCASYYVVERRSTNGDVLARWQSATPPPGTQSDAESIATISIAVSRDGAVWVATSGVLECYKSCPSFAYLDKRSSTGSLTKRWGGLSMGTVPAASALAIGGRGNLFVGNVEAQHIEKRSADNRLLARWGIFHVTVSGFHSPGGVAVDARGNIYATDTGPGLVEKFSPAGKPLAQFGAAGAAPGQYLYPGNVAVDRHRGVWIVDTGNSRVQHVSRLGNLLGRWHVGSPGRSLAVGPDDSVYVGQVIDHRISIGRFSPQGRLQARLGVGMHMGMSPSGMTVDRLGNLYVLAPFAFPAGPGFDASNDGPHILVLSPSGKTLAFIKAPGWAQGQIALDDAHNMYVPEPRLGKVVKLSPAGEIIATWGSRGSGLGQFLRPAGIALDRDRNIYVADTQNNRIAELSPAGTPLGYLGTTGSGTGQFHVPDAVGVNSNGDLFVTDFGNQRIQTLQVEP